MVTAGIGLIHSRQMMASVDPNIAPLLVTSIVGNASNSAQAWTILHNTYANKSHTRIYSLCDQLSRIQKDDKSITEYLHKIREIADELVAAGSPMAEPELTVKILSGLNSNYREVAAAIRNRSVPIEYPELCEKLLDHELCLQSEVKSVSSAIPTVVASQATYTACNGRSNRCFSNNTQQPSNFQPNQWRPNRPNH
ncbi:uncharacterized protein LOC105630092 [Jatropha curcas]|uniref:uncharacterized protein LOC105630092 n=1 Tax=Jatropha curcas TaxID=180498 RepID=UPI0018944BD1|nr:uncharacterized protein LOC105630092 [Jatropha curcas]